MDITRPDTEDLLAGTRPPLPGQSQAHEQRLREELANYFQPSGPIESIWIADIAYCMSEIEMLRVQIAGFRKIAVRKAYASHMMTIDFPPLDGLPECPPNQALEHERFDLYAESDFSPPSPFSFLQAQAFAELVGSMQLVESTHLRILEQMMFDLTKERDRIVNQIDRRRRHAMRDAIEKAEACLSTSSADTTSTNMSIDPENEEDQIALHCDTEHLAGDDSFADCDPSLSSDTEQ